MHTNNSRIPVSILTGFLGAGKSTLLNAILSDPSTADTAVIINEFGEVAIDHLLVGSSGDSVIELSDGCVCCTVRGELVDTLAELMDSMQTGRIRPLRRVVIETTGLADPVPVMQSVIGNPVIAQNFALESVVTVVDAVNGLATLDNHEEAVRQVAVADRLVIAKRRLSGQENLLRLERRLAAINARAAILDADAGSTPSPTLFDAVVRGDHAVHHDTNDHDCGHHHGHDCECGHDHDHHDGHDHEAHHHHHGIRSFSIIHDRPVDPVLLDMFVDLLRSAHGERLLRMKAIVQLAGDPDRPLVLHGVQGLFHAPERLPAWPDPADRRTRLVLITRDLPEEFVRDLFSTFMGTPVLDRPDRAGLTDNPLAIPGLSL